MKLGISHKSKIIISSEIHTLQDFRKNLKQGVTAQLKRPLMYLCSALITSGSVLIQDSTNGAQPREAGSR